jgi:uncharacterized protein (TIGR03435 family)
MQQADPPANGGDGELGFYGRSDGSKYGPVGVGLTDSRARPGEAPDEKRPGVSIAAIIDALGSFHLDRKIVDLTGLKGYYRVDLFIPGFDDPVTRAAFRPDLQLVFDAMKKQLGLQVEKKTALIDTLVVDHVETTPTSN